MEIYHKTKEVLQHFKDKKGHTHNITKEEWEAIKTLREDTSQVVLTADKGIALVVMDMSQYIDMCMTLLNDTKVHNPCRDSTKETSQRCPGNPLTAQQRPWFFKTKLVEQELLQQTAPHR